MAKRETKVLPARKTAASRDDDSLLIRSAESLGRVIGSLQRQVQGTTKRMSNVAEDAMDALPEMPDLGRLAGSGSRKRPATRKAAGARKSSGTRKSGKTRKAAGGRKTKGSTAGGTRKASRGRKTSSRSR
jgi:hypothetical protein